MEQPQFRMQDGKSFRYSTHSDLIGDNLCIPANTEMEITNIEGCGIITNMWFTLASGDENYLKKVIIKAYWDDEETPSIYTPFGDFFCNGFGKKIPFISSPIGVTSGGFYSYFEMPFLKRARFTLTNETDDYLIVYFNINGRFVSSLENTDENPLLYFHANFTRENPTTEGRNYVILKAEGKGYYAGVSLNIAAYEKQSKFNFLEGDEYAYIDGEVDASIKGTGTEDYFQGGWYFCDGPFHAPYHGLVLHDWGDSQISCYRFHLKDRILFNSSISFEIEHGQRIYNEAKADYFSVAYWYQTEPHSKISFPEMPPKEKRLITIPSEMFRIEDAIEAETMELVKACADKDTPYCKDTICYMSTYKEGWSDHIARRLEFREGGYALLVFDIKSEGLYDIGANFIGCDEAGICDLYIDEEHIGRVDTYLDEAKDFELLCRNSALGHMSLKRLRLKQGKHILRIEANSKNINSKGYEITLDCLTARIGV